MPRGFRNAVRYNVGSMARFREYTPARRRAMQALMWVIFAATYAGAVALVHARTEALRVTLTPTITEGDLLFRLPAGWATERHKQRGLLILAAEPGGTDRVHRILQIMYRVEPGPLTATEVMARGSERPLRIHPFTFKNLGQGVSWETPGGIIDEEDDQRVVLPRLYACVVAPRSKHSSKFAVIVVDLTGLTTFGPSSVNLLQSIADSLAVAPNDAMARSVSSDDSGMPAGS